jgi:hypothetical protein
MDQPTVQPGQRVLETRVFYHRTTGEVLHVHRIVAGAGQHLDEDQRQDAIALLEPSLRRQYGELESVTVEEVDVAGEGPLRVDLASRTLIRP